MYISIGIFMTSTHYTERPQRWQRSSGLFYLWVSVKILWYIASVVTIGCPLPSAMHCGIHWGDIVVNTLYFFRLCRSVTLSLSCSLSVVVEDVSSSACVTVKVFPYMTVAALKQQVRNIPTQKCTCISFFHFHCTNSQRSLWAFRCFSSTVFTPGCSGG